MAMYSMGNPVGALSGAVTGGLVADAFGWRAAFLLVRLPGVVLALIELTTLMNPRMRAANAHSQHR